MAFSTRGQQKIIVFFFSRTFHTNLNCLLWIEPSRLNSGTINTWHISPAIRTIATAANSATSHCVQVAQPGWEATECPSPCTCKWQGCATERGPAGRELAAKTRSRGVDHKLVSGRVPVDAGTEKWQLLRSTGRRCSPMVRGEGESLNWQRLQGITIRKHGSLRWALNSIEKKTAGLLSTSSREPEMWGCKTVVGQVPRGGRLQGGHKAQNVYGEALSGSIPVDRGRKQDWAGETLAAVIQSLTQGVLVLRGCPELE